MNQKELNELRRRFRLDKNNFSRVYGCYVNSNREIIAWVDTSMGLMRQEEQEMYLGLLKKSLSGTLGKNLIDVVFSTQQVADSDEHRLLQTLRQTELKDPASRETLCRQIIDCIDMGETNYLILLAAGMLASLLLTMVLYMAGADRTLCILVALVCMSLVVWGTFHMNRCYGPHGLMKRLAARRHPRRIIHRRSIRHLIVKRN